MNSLNTRPRAVFPPAFLLHFTGRNCYRDGLNSVLNSHALNVFPDLKVGQFDRQACRRNSQPVGLRGAI
jgi:hypothetical protein